MQRESQQGGGGFPVFCIECHMYDYLPQGQKSWVCSHCNELLALREQVRSLEAKVADLEKLREAERRIDEAFGDLIAGSHSQGDISSDVMENEGPGDRGRQPVGVGSAPLEGTPSLAGDELSSCTEDTPLGGGGILVVGDSIIRNIESWVCDRRDNRMVTCLPGAKVADVTLRLDRLLDSAGEESAVVVHIGTNDVGKCSREVLEAKFRLLGRKLKSRTSKVAFSELLPVPRAGPARQMEIQRLNAWMRRWCRTEGFRFVRNWGTFWDKASLYKRDGLHLNRKGTRLLALNIKKVAEQFLN